MRVGTLFLALHFQFALIVQILCRSLEKSKSNVLTKDSSLSDVEQFITANHQLYSNTLPDKRLFWPDGIVPYEIRESDFSKVELTRIRDAMREFDDKTCVKFKIRQQEKSFVLIRKGRECKSDVGRLGGKQAVILGSRCMNKGVIIHELMHVIGFLHEQERSDRDEYVHILWRNVEPKMQLQFSRLPKAIAMTTSYDYDSIMHYDKYAFTKNGLPTLQTKYSATIGQRGGFSFMDLVEINILYKCKLEIKKLKFS